MARNDSLILLLDVENSYEFNCTKAYQGPKYNIFIIVLLSLKMSKVVGIFLKKMLYSMSIHSNRSIVVGKLEYIK